VIGVAMALLIDNDPRDRGLGPDGAALAPERESEPPPGTPRRDAVRSRPFLGLYAACTICSFGLFVPFVHLVPYAVDHQVPRGSAVLLVGMIGAGSTAGRFFLGSMADRIGRKRALVVMFAGMAATLAVWAASSGFWLLAGFALAYGVFYGGFVAVIPALVMDYFGSRHISGIIGALYTSVAFGTLVGPSAAGFAFDLRHSYALPIAASIAANAIAAAIVAAIDGPAAYIGAMAPPSGSTPVAIRNRDTRLSRSSHVAHVS
jgi:MFS family permease